MSARCRIVALLLALASPPLIAGTDCRERTVTPTAVAAAAQTAMRTRAALDAVDAPVALVARVGTDLRAHGLVYSHVGFARREHADGPWTVVHLLNRCGTDRSGLHAEGLVNFFSDQLVNQDARVLWLEPALAARVAASLDGDAIFALHQPRYSVIARPDSRDYQNSTAWVLDVLASASLASDAPSRALARQAATDHRPDRIHIPYRKRVLGGLFSANLAFTDHPIGTRLAGDYPVVTVRSIRDWLRRRGVIVAEREWRNGVEQAPGPA
jgi:hypothetical protein